MSKIDLVYPFCRNTGFPRLSLHRSRYRKPIARTVLAAKLHRREIDSRDALSIARSLTDVFDRICVGTAK